jgi:hypothetical protein
MSRPKRRAEAVRGASALSAFDAEALTSFGEKSGEEGEISRRARCWRKLELSGPMTARSPVVYCAATEVGKINMDEMIAKAEWNATGTTTACPGCKGAVEAVCLVKQGSSPYSMRKGTKLMSLRRCLGET